MDVKTIMVDGIEAAARIAYVLDEVIAIYPITPSSPMGELSDEWSAVGRTNLRGAVPRVEAEMRKWMAEHEYESVRQMQGSMSQRSVAEPAAFERANYMKVLRSHALEERHDR